jgi:hypothetical protein
MLLSIYKYHARTKKLDSDQTFLALCPSPLMGGGRGWVKHAIIGFDWQLKA